MAYETTAPSPFYDKATDTDGGCSVGSGVSPLYDKLKPLTITAPQVRAAATKCPDADRVLRELFPDVFAPPPPPPPPLYEPVSSAIQFDVRGVGGFKGFGYYLPKGTAYYKTGVARTWRVITDNEGIQVLIHELAK